MSKEKSGIVGVYAGREVTAQDIANAFSELEAVRQENISLKAKIESKPLTCKGCENFSEDGFADICWGCRRNREIPDYYSNPKETDKAHEEWLKKWGIK